MSKQGRAALLISGGINSRMNHARYGNDLERWTHALQARGFDCAVCFGDGAGLNVAGARIRPATRSDIDAELSLLCGLAADDLAVILVSNHGDAMGFCTWGADRVTPADLATALNDCAATKILIFGQCYGGVFGSITLPDTVVITACGPSKPSWACASPPGAHAYDEFLFQLAGALFETVATSPGNPHASTSCMSQPSNPGPTAVPATMPTMAAMAGLPVSLRSAFDLAAARDRRPETPALADPAGLTDTLVLG